MGTQIDPADVVPATPAIAGADGARGKRRQLSRTWCLMGSYMHVRLALDPNQDPAEGEWALTAIGDWLGEVDARLSRFSPASELSRLNRTAGEEVAVSGVIFAAVEQALEAAAASGGRFDPTLLAQIEALGYDRDFALVDSASSSAQVAAGVAATERVPFPRARRPGGGWRGITLDPVRRRIRLPEGVALDLGGIAKGWAADVALERCCGAFPGALINVGGDLRLRGGPQPGVPWSVGIYDPRRQRSLAAPADAEMDGDGDGNEDGDEDGALYRAQLGFSRGGLATSGAVRRWWWQNGTRRHHLLDPATGLPMEALCLDLAGSAADDQRMRGAEGEPPAARPAPIATVTALAPTGARAEVATKVALLRGYPAALRAVEEAWARWGAVAPDDASTADAGVALVLVLGDGRLVSSANLSAWLESWGTDGAPVPLQVGFHDNG